MRIIKTIWVSMAVALGCFAFQARATQLSEVDFERDIRPLLYARCIEAHQTARRRTHELSAAGHHPLLQ